MVKVFYRLLMFSAVKSWVIYKELNRQPKKPLLDFLVELAEALIARGQLRCPVRRHLGSGRRSKRARSMENVGTHVPTERQKRRRCAGCAQKGKEKRTKTLRMGCNTPYCTRLLHTMPFINELPT
jgi:hypothetical protein